MRDFVKQSVNPNDYDLRELRDRSEDRSIHPKDTPGNRQAETVLRPGYYRELLLLQSGAGDSDLTKPYLAAMPTSYEGEVVVFEWLEGLIKKGGFKRTTDALRHYRALGWITESVENRLSDYLSGVPEPDSDATRPFDQSDHLQSLIYIGRLASA